MRDLVAELRQSFDQAFAMPPPEPEGDRESLITFRAHGEFYALRIVELSGLYALPRIVPLPAKRDHLMGLAGIRGRLIAVYRLATLLGHAGGGEKWLALSRGDDPVGLAFTDLEGFLQVPRAQLRPAGSARRFVLDAVSIDSALHGVIKVPAVLEAIRHTSTNTEGER